MIDLIEPAAEDVIIDIRLDDMPAQAELFVRAFVNRSMTPASQRHFENLYSSGTPLEKALHAAAINDTIIRVLQEHEAKTHVPENSERPAS